MLDKAALDNWIMKEQPVCECPDDCEDCTEDECCGKCQEEGPSPDAEYSEDWDEHEYEMLQSMKE